MELYISDLDGTLLNSEQKISRETLEVINELIEKGLNFSIATARSIISAGPILEPLNLKLPIVLHNGVFVYDPITKKNILSNYIPSREAESMIEIIQQYGFSPMVFTSKDSIGDKIYYTGIHNEGEKYYINSRLLNGDKRFTLVRNFNGCTDSNIITLVIISEDKRLSTLHTALKESFDMTFHYTQDIYSKFYWLEITNKDANKKAAVEYVKKYLAAKKLICFGDNLNDYSMFEIADEKYAMANGHPLLKGFATKVIGSNDEHSVSKFIKDTWRAS